MTGPRERWKTPHPWTENMIKLASLQGSHSLHAWRCFPAFESALRSQHSDQDCQSEREIRSLVCPPPSRTPMSPPTQPHLNTHMHAHTRTRSTETWRSGCRRPRALHPRNGICTSTSTSTSTLKPKEQASTAHPIKGHRGRSTGHAWDCMTRETQSQPATCHVHAAAKATAAAAAASGGCRGEAT